jgi:hypothetical protein
MSFETSALLVSWVAIALLALVVSGLVRQVHALTSGHVHGGEVGPRTGSPAPALSRLGSGQAGTVLLFLSEGCGPCEEILDEAASLAAGAAAHDVAVRALYPSTAPSLPRAPSADPPADLTLLDGEATLFEQYMIPATPFAVLVDATGRVARSEPLGSRRALRQLLDRATGTATPALARTPVPSRMLSSPEEGDS